VGRRVKVHLPLLNMTGGFIIVWSFKEDRVGEEVVAMA
jgi:hypothetical protein